MATTPTDAKICLKCGTDCSGKPRTKDTQGRYMCRSCVDAASLAAKPAATRAAPAVPSKAPGRAAAPKASVAGGPDDMDVMATLLKDSPVITQQCAQCGIGMTADAVICTACGYNKETGRAMNVRVQAAERDKKIRAPRSGQPFEFNPMWTALIAIGALVGLFILAMNNPDMAMVYIGVFGLLSLATWISAIFFAFKDGNSGWGVVGLLSWVPIVGLAFLYYVFAINERGHIKALWGASVIGAIMNIFLRVQTGGV